MKLLFVSDSLQGTQDEPFQKLVKVEARPSEETPEDRLVLHFLREQPEILVFGLDGIKGEWHFKKSK